MYRTIKYIFRWIAILFLAVGGTGSIAAGNGTGMTPVAMGGGSIEDAVFQSGAEEEVTFSFFAAFDNDGNPEGSFHFRRGYPDGKVSVVLSTEITGIVVQDPPDQTGCAVMEMTGIAKLIPSWKTATPRNPRQDQQFTLDVEDCDGYSDETGTDMIWFEVKNAGGGVRPGLSLQDHLFAVKGNILIR